MTVNTTNITDGPYAGNDVADTFNYTFRIEADTEIKVFETDLVGVITELTLTTNYTVTGVGNDAGGTVVRVAGALPTGFTWYIRSDYKQTQGTDFESQSAFFSVLHELAFDKLTFLVQQLQDNLARSLSHEESYTGVLNPTLPAPVSGQYLTWKADLTGFENSSTSVNFSAPGEIGGTTANVGNFTVLNATSFINTGSSTLEGITLSGGVLNTNGRQSQWSKGADVASATALPVLTDGNYFDVTGTAGIATIATTKIGNIVKLHFNGILILTNSADLVLLGAANITTAAGDEAELIEYATGDYRMLNYSRLNGQPLVPGTAVGNHEVEADTGNGHGSTNTKIRRFVNAAVEVGTAITYVDSATLGGKFTINETGLYSIYYIDTGSGASVGVSLNSAQLTTDINTITKSDRKMFSSFSSAGGFGYSQSIVLSLSSTDVIRAHNGGTLPVTTGVAQTVFRIRKIGLV